MVATLPSAAEAAGTTARVVGPQYAGPPVQVLLFGDSVAWRLGFAMLASQPQNSYDVDIDNGAIVGCGVVRSTQYRAHGVADPMAPAVQHRRARARASGRPSGQGDLDQFQPNVVVVLAGRWEVVGPADRRPVAAHRRAGLRRRPQGSRWSRPCRWPPRPAPMVLMTSPCFDSGEQPNGQPWPEDSPARLADYNAIVRQVAAEHPATVQVDDFGAHALPGRRLPRPARRGPDP